MESEYLSSYRTLLAAFFLIPLCLYDIKSKANIQVKEYFKLAFLPGFLLALHFISWMHGCRMAEPANCSLIVNLTPLVTPLFLFVLIKEKLTPREVIGTVIVMVGVAVLAFYDFNESSAFFLGDMICLISMLFFALYLIYSRKYKKLDSLWLYVACLYTWCGILCFITGLIIGKKPFDHFNSNNLQQILYLTVITTILGHSLLNFAMKNIRGQIVSIVNQFQFIFGALFGVIFFDRWPSIPFYIACLFLFIGCFVAVYRPKTSANLNTN